jgi:hypothetical protein
VRKACANDARHRIGLALYERQLIADGFIQQLQRGSRQIACEFLFHEYAMASPATS